MGADGHQITLDFVGPTLAAALARAVEEFGEAFADVHPSLVSHRHAVALEAATPSGLLLCVLEECLRQGREGQVAVALDAEVVDGRQLRGTIDTVSADEPHVDATLPHVLSWHEVTLEPDENGGWRARVIAR